MTDTYVTCTVSPCVIVHQIDLPPFNLDTVDGGLIAAAVLSIWAIGFGFRALIRTMGVIDPLPDQS